MCVQCTLGSKLFFGSRLHVTILRLSPSVSFSLLPERMFCRKCCRHPPMKCWTASQRRMKQSSNGSRNECRECHRRGPTVEDWDEVVTQTKSMDKLGYDNIDLKYEDFLVVVFCHMPWRVRKDWSYNGMLPVRVATDNITWKDPEKFDPTNEVYACVLRREAPNIKMKMGWSSEPNDETCGDCIEGLLAIAEQHPNLEYGGIQIESGARFWREQAYACWRIFRILRWDRYTTKRHNITLDAFFLQTTCAMNKRRCTCDHLSTPHLCTLQCSKCGVRGCGMHILYSHRRLLCEGCIDETRIQLR